MLTFRFDPLIGDGHAIGPAPYFRIEGGELRAGPDDRTVATYANGSPILVNPTSGAPVATGGVPLTLAMINDPSSPLYAAPNADSGSITGAAFIWLGAQ